jgi:hypothetical protein
LTGHRTYSRRQKYIEFTVAEYLFLDDNPIEMANNLLSLENQIVTFSFAVDGGLVQEMFIENVEIKPITDSEPYDHDIAFISLKNIDYLFESKIIKARTGQKIKTISDKFIKTRGIII